MICLRLVSFALSLEAFAIAQSVPIPKAGNVEISGIVGFNFAGSSSSVSTTAVNTGATPLDVASPSSNGSFGAQVSVAISRPLLLAAECSYIAGGSIQFNQDYYLAQQPISTRRTAVSAGSKILDLNGSLQYAIPLRINHKTVPYAIMGMGILRSSSSIQLAAIGLTPGAIVADRFSRYSLALNGGGWSAILLLGKAWCSSRG